MKRKLTLSSVIPGHAKKGAAQQLYLGSTLYGRELTIRGLKPERLPEDYEVDQEILAELPFEDLSAAELNNLLYPPFPILDFPEEIINEIITQAYYRPNQRQWHGRICCNEGGSQDVALTLSRVCKVFHRIASPLLYRSLRLYSFALDNDAFFEKDDLKLFQTLTQNPKLSRHCKDLALDINIRSPEYGSERHEWLESIDWSQPQGPSHRVCGCASENEEHQKSCMWTFLRQTVDHMSGLEQIDFNLGYSSGVACVKSMCEMLTPFRHLKRLTVGQFWRRSVCPKVRLLVSRP